jgi:hypothetical protein
MGGDDAPSVLYGPGEPGSKPVAGGDSARTRPPTTPGDVETPPCRAGALWAKATLVLNDKPTIAAQRTVMFMTISLDLADEGTFVLYGCSKGAIAL